LVVEDKKDSQENLEGDGEEGAEIVDPIRRGKVPILGEFSISPLMEDILLPIVRKCHPSFR
jgi:hypothetical protein